MARLLQGDVGSGKTAVAAAALVDRRGERLPGRAHGADRDPGGAALPHADRAARTGSRSTAGRLRVELLTGSLTGVEVEAGDRRRRRVGRGRRRRRHARADPGRRVVQAAGRGGGGRAAPLRRDAARGAARNAPWRPDQPTPHLLVMSATPIPRTLALTFFGDLDVSVIDEMPPGRLPVRHALGGAGRPRARPTASCASRCTQGRQAFVVCPLIEESAALQTRSATQEYERLSTRGLPGAAAGAAARAHVGGGEGRGAAGLPARRAAHPGRDDGDRGRHRHPERERDGDRGRGPLRAGAAAPAARPRRTRRGAELLPAALGRPVDGRAGSGCSCWRRPTTASRWRRRTCGCAAPATTSARGRAACRSSRRPTSPTWG